MRLNMGDAQLSYEDSQKTVVLAGSLRLQGMVEYEKVKVFLHEVATRAGEMLTMDMRRLQFLNSSGITTLSMFVIALRRQNATRLLILGSRLYGWQPKSLPNLKLLWSDVELQFSSGDGPEGQA